MEDTLANQYQLMQSIEKILINFKKDGAERKTYSNIQRRLSTLNTYWNEFNSNHQQLIDYQDVEHEYFKQNCYVRTKEFYQRLSTYLEDYSLFLEDPKSHEIPTTPRPGAITTFELPPKVKTSPFKVTPPTIEISRGTPDQAASASSATPTPPVHQFSDTVSTAKQDQKGLTHFLDRSTTSKLEEKLRKQKTNFKAFSRTITNIDFDNLSEKWEFEDILKHVEARWEAVDSLHWEIDSERYGEDEDYERTFNRYEREYNDIKKALNQKMWSVSYKSKTTPTMEIPTFNGDYNKWVSFKDLFTETIHNNRSISNAQKMQYLKSKVKDEAERLIHHLSISTENYQVCWDILNHRYNNKKLIFSSHMNILMSLPIIQQQSSTLIKKIHDTAKECLNAVKNLGVDTSSWGPILVHILSHKLDSETHKDYIESVKNPRDLPSLEEFFEFLENKFTSLEASRRKQDSANQKTSTPPSYNKKKPYQFQHSNYNNHNNYEQRAIGKSLHVSSASKCPHCNGEHGIFNCKQFLDMSNELKLKTVNKLRLCSNCLHDHKNKKCMSTKTCRKCIEPHNTLLHEAFTKSSISNNKKSSDSVHVSQKKSAEVLLATALVKVLAADGTHHRMRALVDQGSQISLITENAAQLLGLPRRHCKGVVFGLGAQQNNSKGALDISVTSMHGNFNFNASVVIMNNLMHNLPNQSFEKPSWPHLEGINLADPEFHTSRPIDMLLGAEIYSLIILGGVVKGNCDEPIAQQTHLGWLLCGNVKTYQCNVVLNNLDDIQRFWTIEDVAEDPVELSAEGHYCIKHYQENTTRRLDGRYVVRYPMKPELSVKLGDSKTRAVAQFLQLEKRLSKNYNLSNSYKAFIHEYINLGHMHDASNDRNKTPSLACYLPHHCVLRAESTTTALRVVVNASSPTSSGYSLNDLMYSGPNLQKDLLSLILRWRQYEVAFIADIEKMFRQILIHPQDRNLQKIIWRDDKQEMLREYNLATVTYGTKAAPFLAMMTLKQLAKDEGPKYTLSTAKQALEEEFYMDDLLSGSHSIPAAKQLQSDLLQLFKSGGFNLRKWASNKKELIESVETISSTQSFDFKHPESTKTLGLRWDPKNDDFSFQIKLSPPSQKPLSKRVLLSEISKVFDPLGWLSPVTTKLKLLFQKVWLQNIQWDSKLPEEFNVEWQTIRKDLDNINQIKVRRWLQTQVNDNIELHGFCDSSIKAYACVIYCKLTKQTTDGREYQSINIVAAKSRLVPVNKTITLPRLELMSCLLLSKLIQTVQKSLPHHNIKTFGWTDSTAALGWLQGDTKRWKTFVANRVEQIIAVIPPKQWHYVKSAENPADCASRGITVNQLLRTNQKHQALLWKNQTSVVEAQNNLLQRVEDSMNKQHKLINQHLNNIQRVTNSIQKEIQAVATSSDFALSSIIANSILTNLRNIQEYLLNTIVDLHHGTFNFHLITPEQFKDELNVISGLLSKDLSLPINNIPSDLPKLYHLLKVKAKMTKEFFIFEIGIPLVTRDYYEIYHLIPIPHNNQNNMICITTISNYIAMNIQKDSFLPMSGSDLLRCNRNNEITYLCPLQKPVYRMTSDKNLCEKDELSAQCKTNTIPCKTVWYELHETNRYLYACCGQCTVRVICGNQVSSELLSESGIISLSDGCIIKSQSFTIFSHRQQSNTLKIEADILNIEIPPINHIIELPFPSFNQSNANETHNNQTYIHEQLQEIGKRIQQLKQSETEVILTDRTSTHDVTQYVLIGSLIIIVIGIIFAWRRLHTGQICLSRYETGEVAARAIHTPASSAPADNMTPPPPVRREAPLPPPPQTASSAKPPRFINKATSPICRTHFREHDK